MKLRIFLEPQQGASYLGQLRIAQAAEHYGFDALFRSDHYLRMGDGSGEPGPTDAWVTLGALARETSTIRLGTLLTAATFRYPGQLAIIVAQVDDMSNGRVELGLGAGWFEEEHRAYGLEFPETPERFERLSEQLEVVLGLWRTDPSLAFSYAGKYYQLQDSPGLPKPRQRPNPPIVIGGVGRSKTPALAARFADEFNIPFVSIETAKAQFDRVDQACVRIERDPTEISRSVALVACVGESEEDAQRRANAIGRELGELKESGVAGQPSEVVEKLLAYREIGVSRVYLQILDISDLEHLALISSEVMAHLN